MEEETIFDTEFQVTYADTPTLREGKHNSLLLRCGLCSDFLPTAIVEKSDKHYLSQLIKANIYSDKS